MAEAKAAKTQSVYIVYQGEQPIFSDSDKETAQHFLQSRKVECKRQGIDVSAQEHKLSIR